MNKKGFTLVELLAVIVILAVVMLIGSVSIGTVRNRISKNMFETKLELAIGAAKKWGQDNKEELKQWPGDLVYFIKKSDLTNYYRIHKTYSYARKTIGDLIASKDLETDERDHGNAVITNDLSGKVINDLEIIVYIANNRVYACIEASPNNRSVLEEKSDWSEYSHLNYYCK